jgi:hypothetical protein
MERADRPPVRTPAMERQFARERKLSLEQSLHPVPWQLPTDRSPNPPVIKDPAYYLEMDKITAERIALADERFIIQTLFVEYAFTEMIPKYLESIGEIESIPKTRSDASKILATLRKTGMHGQTLTEHAKIWLDELTLANFRKYADVWESLSEDETWREKYRKIGAEINSIAKLKALKAKHPTLYLSPEEKRRFAERSEEW